MNRKFNLLSIKLSSVRQKGGNMACKHLRPENNDFDSGVLQTDSNNQPISLLLSEHYSSFRSRIEVCKQTWDYKQAEH